MKITKQQLERLIENKIQKILKEIDFDKKIKNPETGRMIKIGSALSYPKDSTVHKSAQAIVNKTKEKEEKSFSKKSSTKYNELEKLSSEDRSKIKTKTEKSLKNTEKKYANFKQTIQDDMDNEFTDIQMQIEDSGISTGRQSRINNIMSSFAKTLSKDYEKSYDKEYLKTVIKDIQKETGDHISSNDIAKSILSAAKIAQSGAKEHKKYKNTINKHNDIISSINDIEEGENWDPDEDEDF